MVAIPKIVGGSLCGVMLFLGLQATHVYAETSAGYEINAKRSERTMNERLLIGVQTRQDQVLRVEGGNDFVKNPTGKELRLILDPSTQKIPTVQLGDRIDGKGSILVQPREVVLRK